MGLRPAKSHEKLSGRRLADEILWGRLVTCGRLAIGPCRLRGGPAAVTNRRAGCQPAPHWFFDPVNQARFHEARQTTQDDGLSYHPPWNSRYSKLQHVLTDPPGRTRVDQCRRICRATDPHPETRTRAEDQRPGDLPVSYT